MADWSELLPELLINIANCVTALPDQVSFCGVCKSWQSAALTLKNFNFSLPQSPFLLLASEDEPEPETEQETGDLRRLLLLPSSISNLRLPEAKKRHCLSSRGWLLTIGEDDNDVNLLNPITRQRISLPKLDTFSGINNCDCGSNDDHFFDDLELDHIHDYIRHTNEGLPFVSKMVLSCDNPLSQDCLVMVIWGNIHRLGFCRPGDESWTDLAGWIGWIDDITYHNRLLYGFVSGGRMVVCDVHDSNPTIFKVADKQAAISRVLYLPGEDFSLRPYVLAGFSDKKLLIVIRLLETGPDFCVNFKDYETLRFHVFELDLESNTCLQVENLGGRAIFLGFNSSMWIDADGSAVKGNCIYFTDDYLQVYKFSTSGVGKDVGVYNLSEGSVLKLQRQLNVECCSKVCPPIWIEPTLHCN